MQTRDLILNHNELRYVEDLGDGAGAVARLCVYEGNDPEIERLCVVESGLKYLVFKQPKEGSEILNIDEEQEIANHLSSSPGQHNFQRSVLFTDAQGKQIRTVISRPEALIVIPETKTLTKTNPPKFICYNLEKLIKTQTKNSGTNQENIENPKNFTESYLSELEEDLDLILFQMAFSAHQSMLDIHKKGVLHLDIALRNCLGKTGEDKNKNNISAFTSVLTDYGLSKFADKATQLPDVGPLKWMDLNRLYFREATVTSDFYAFRIFLLEMIAGLTGDYDSFLTKIMADPLGYTDINKIIQFVWSKGWGVLDTFTANAERLVAQHPRAQHFFNYFKEYLTPLKNCSLEGMNPQEIRDHLIEVESTLKEKENLFIDQNKLNEFFSETLRTKLDEYISGNRTLYSFLRAVNLLIQEPIKSAANNDEIYKLCEELASYPLDPEYIRTNETFLNSKILELNKKVFPIMELENEIRALVDDYDAMVEKSKHLNSKTATLEDLEEINCEKIMEARTLLREKVLALKRNPKTSALLTLLDEIANNIINKDAEDWKKFDNVKNEIYRRDYERAKAELSHKKDRYNDIRKKLMTKQNFSDIDIVLAGEALGQLEAITHLENICEQLSKTGYIPNTIERFNVKQEKLDLLKRYGTKPEFKTLFEEFENIAHSEKRQHLNDLISDLKFIGSIENVELNLGLAQVLIDNQSKDANLFEEQLKNLYLFDTTFAQLKERLKQFPNLKMAQILALAKLHHINLGDETKIKHMLELPNQIENLHHKVSKLKALLETKQPEIKRPAEKQKKQAANYNRIRNTKARNEETPYNRVVNAGVTNQETPYKPLANAGMTSQTYQPIQKKEVKNQDTHYQPVANAGMRSQETNDQPVTNVGLTNQEKTYKSIPNARATNPETPYNPIPNAGATNPETNDNRPIVQNTDPKIQKISDDQKSFIEKIKSLVDHYDALLKNRGNVLKTPQRIFLAHFLLPYRAILKVASELQNPFDTVLHVLQGSGPHSNYQQALLECARNQRGFNLLVDKLENLTGKADQFKALIESPFEHENNMNKSLEALKSADRNDEINALKPLIPHAEVLRKERQKTITHIKEKTHKVHEDAYSKQINKRIHAKQYKKIDAALQLILDNINTLFPNKIQNKKIKNILKILAHYAKHQKNDKVGLVRTNKVLEVFVNISQYTKKDVIDFYLSKKLQSDIDINTHRNTAHTDHTTLAKYLKRLRLTMSEGQEKKTKRKPGKQQEKEMESKPSKPKEANPLRAFYSRATRSRHSKLKIR